MIIRVRNKHILEIDDFQFRCCVDKMDLQIIKLKVINAHPKEVQVK